MSGNTGESSPGILCRPEIGRQTPKSPAPAQGGRGQPRVQRMGGVDWRSLGWPEMAYGWLAVSNSMCCRLLSENTTHLRTGPEEIKERVRLKQDGGRWLWVVRMSSARSPGHT